MKQEKWTKEKRVNKKQTLKYWEETGGSQRRGKWGEWDTYHEEHGVMYWIVDLLSTELFNVYNTPETNITVSVTYNEI